MASQPRIRPWAEARVHVARARELLAKYELNRANPLGDFASDPQLEAELDKLLDKLR